MGDTNKTISIQYKAEVQNLVQGLTKVGNTSEKEARKIINSLEKAYDKAARESQKSIAKQEKELKKLRRQAQKTSKAMDLSAKNMAIGFAAAGVAVLGFQQHIADLSNQLVDASTKTGVAVDTLAGLRLAAEGSGLSFENLEAGLIKLPGLMQSAADGGKRAKEAFEGLGVSVTETEGDFEKLRSADDVLKDVFKSLQAVESAEEKAAKAAEIFGMRAGPAFVQSGAIDNLESFMDLANEFGVSTGPSMQKQMAEFQRVSSAALTLVQGEFSRILGAIAGEGGINNAIMLASEGVIAFGIIAQKQIELLANGFGLVTGIVSNAFSVVMGGSVADAVEKNNQNLKDLGNSFISIGGIFDEIDERQTKFRESLQKTLETPVPVVPLGGGGGDGKPGDDTTEDEKKALKEALKLEKERVSLKKFVLSLTKENESAQISLNTQQANLLDGVERERALLEANLESIELQKKQYIDRTNAIIFGLETVEGKEAELDSIFQEREERFKQFEKQKENITIEGIRNISEAQREADKEEAERQEKKLQDIAKQTQMFAQVTQEFTNLGELGVQLFERFGDKNKKNAEIAFNVRKGIAISEVAINTATAVTRALAELGPVAGGLASAGIIATGTAQAALIASEEPKFHMGGLVGGGGLAPDERRITAKTGEAVLSTQAVQRMGGEAGVNAIENGNAITPMVVVTNPFKHYDRFIKGRRLMGLDSTRTGRGGY